MCFASLGFFFWGGGGAFSPYHSSFSLSISLGGVPTLLNLLALTQSNPQGQGVNPEILAIMPKFYFCLSTEQGMNRIDSSVGRASTFRAGGRVFESRGSTIPKV